MARLSAGLLMYRFRDGSLEVLIAHPGGPFWRGKDEGAWSIPKGEYQEGEDHFDAARREFTEETGFVAVGPFIPLSPLKQPGGKIVSAWAFEGDCEPSLLRSNTFTIEWPPRSGKKAEFPEMDRAGWFTPEVARRKLLKGQAGFIDELCGILKTERYRRQ